MGIQTEAMAVKMVAVPPNILSTNEAVENSRDFSGVVQHIVDAGIAEGSNLKVPGWC